MALSTWISSVTNSTLNISTLSFQDALYPSGKDTPNGYYDPPFLIQNGCLQNDGTQNCTASCQDPNDIFGSLDTLHNCMVYPTVADLYARSNLSNASLAQTYGIEKSKMGSDLYNNITSTIQACLVDYCTITLDGSGCIEALKVFNASASPMNINSTFYIYTDEYEGYDRFDFCQYVPSSFNPDIGGIGVYVSYWIQTGLALLSFLLVVWWNWGIYYICFGALLVPRGYSRAKKIAQRVRNNSRNKHLPSLTGALAEFQKAQCFFMLAINIAALVNRNSGGFQPNSLQQLYNTYILIKSISISGYLPVTFTLFTLHLVDVVSWYLLVLSILTVLVSIATLFVIGNFSPSQDDLNYLSQQALSGGPDSCGTKNLLVYCYSPLGGAAEDYDSINPASGAYSMLAFCLVVLILLIANQYHAFKDPSTGNPKPWLSFVRYKLSLRKIQFGLALISIGLNGYAISWYPDSIGDEYGDFSLPNLGPPEFVLFASCWTLLFVLYLSLTSATAYTRTERPIGRFFNQKLAFAVDSLSTVFWFAGFIALAIFYQTFSLCACIAFVATTVFAARHMLRTRNERSDKHNRGKQYWVLQRFSNHYLKRQLIRKVPSWKRFTRKVPSWKQTSRKIPSWMKRPMVVDAYTRLQQNTLPTMKVHTRRAYQDVKTHVSTLDWPSTATSAAFFSMYLVFFSLYIHWFNIFIQDLAWFAYNGVDSSSWSFGQVVAIMVWAEPLSEYFHLELRGMKRGFEHRLWGYKVVKIKQPDTKRGTGSSSSSSVRSPSPTASLDDQESGKSGMSGTVKEPPVEGGLARDVKDSDEEKGAYSKLENAEPTIRPVPDSREGIEETEEREGEGEWQIPETVILTSDSISPF
ncbi:MAG: hypothetical protein ASARMPRED_005411 [Alectoria sarmentosa]|nr:MAG: hypothetical protein ASARMPRED_005411 [Alectoria sarmentosa]